MQQAAHVRRFGTKVQKIDPGSDHEDESWEEFWALYEVGTCEFIIGLSCAREANVTAKRDGARALAKKCIAAFERVLNDYPAAQCFDPNGPWYWRVRDGAEEHLPGLRRRLRSLDS